MLERFRTFVHEHDLVGAGDITLLAVSGGVDSVVMADLFSKAGYKFAIAHCNFRLRGAESEGDEEFTKQLADRLRVPFCSKSFDTLEYSKRQGISIQMAARDLRYLWFDELMDRHGFDSVAAAHHLDDEAESFLINLFRGTGIAGLHGIMVKRGRIIRPMMFATRSDIEKYASDNNLDFRKDSSNSEDDYLRNRIRHFVIPEFEKADPDFRAGIRDTIMRIRDAEIIYRQAIEDHRASLFRIEDDRVRISIEELRRLQPLQSWIFELFRDYGCNEAAAKDIADSLDSIPGKVFHFKEYKLLKDRDDLILTYCSDDTGEEVQIDSDLISTDSPVKLVFKRMDAAGYDIRKEASVAALDEDKLRFPLILRRWKPGDFFHPLGMQEKKKLSDFFTDMKINLFDKQKIWLLCSGDDIVWIVGHRIDNRYKVTPATKRVLEIELFLTLQII